MLKFTQTIYPEWTVEEIARELAQCFDTTQNANKNPEVHIDKESLYLGFAYKIKEWAESKLRYGTLTATYTTNISDKIGAANDLYDPCAHCPNNKGPGTICNCTLGTPKITC